MRLPFVAFILLISVSASFAEKHLFILSGQSNMVGLNHNTSFMPHIEEALGAGESLYVKVARGGQPILRWYKKWAPPAGMEPPTVKGNVVPGDYYAKIMQQVDKLAKNNEFKTVTLVWMQGERDAKGYSAVYEESLLGLVQQLQDDLGRKDINFVIGRLSDGQMESKNYYEWKEIREIQVKVAESYEHGAWVDTDDIEMKGDNLHYSAEGFQELGKRFAEASIKLIKE